MNSKSFSCSEAQSKIPEKSVHASEGNLGIQTPVSPASPNLPCSTCAFGKAGGAADEPYNRLRGLIVVAAGIPFYCHHTKSGEEYDWKKGNLGFFEVPPKERVVCAGWKREIQKLKQRFHFTDDQQEQSALRRYQRYLGDQAFRKLDEMNEAETGTEKRAEAFRKLQDLLEALNCSIREEEATA